METQDMKEAMASALDHRLSEVVRLPEISALTEPARMAYRAGWDEAADVSGNNPDTHPADRRLGISDKRMDAILAQLPKTGTGWLSGTLYRTERTVRRYAARGYHDSAQHAAVLAFQDHLESHPEQAEPQELERRLEYLDQMMYWGSAETLTAQGIGHMPRTMEGRGWMTEQVHILLEEKRGKKRR